MRARPTPPGTNHLPAEVGAFARYAARALDRLEHGDSARRLLDAIARVVPFKFAMSVVHQRDAAPVHMADTFARRAEQSALALYLSSTWVLNPVYNAYLGGLVEGVYRLRDLAPDNYFSSDYYQQFKVQQMVDEEIGYRTHGWPVGLEELIVAITLPHGKLAEISLSRPVRTGGFSDADCQRLRDVAPLIAAIYRRIWQHDERHRDTTSQHGATPPSGHNALDTFLRGFGQGTLSARECEVAQLILKGHSSESISLHLNISITTVKSHRKNLYTKLGIATQQELFARFLASLGQRLSPPPEYENIES